VSEVTEAIDPAAIGGTQRSRPELPGKIWRPPKWKGKEVPRLELSNREGRHKATSNRARTDVLRGKVKLGLKYRHIKEAGGEEKRRRGDLMAWIIATLQQGKEGRLINTRETNHNATSEKRQKEAPIKKNRRRGDGWSKQGKSA